MLKKLVESKPKDLAHAIRTFVNNTAMLRESGFRHIGVMLEHVLLADASGGAVSDAAIVALDPSSVTKKHAIAIGGVIASSVRRSHVPRTALKRIVESHPVLRAVTLGHVWFVPMLEALTAREVASRRSLFVRRSSSIATAEFHGDAGVDIAAQDGADEASSFSSAVTALPHACVCARAIHAFGCARPAFRPARSTVSRTQLQVVPADVCASEVVEDMPSSLAPNSAEMQEGGQCAQRIQEFVYEGDP
jgi:hypothetical protein